MVSGLARKALLEEVIKKRFFISHAYEIYGGMSRVLDLGPVGVQLQSNIIDQWKKHFVHQEKLLQLKSSCLTPKSVLKSSGHLDRFSDPAVKDVVTGDVFRLDHLINQVLSSRLQDGNMDDKAVIACKDILSKLNSMSPTEMSELVSKYCIKSPISGNPLSSVFEMNLMFRTTSGLNSDVYLRPELSQSAFVNFRKLLDFNRNRLPFGVAQIGSGFRNELTQGASLTRMKEFTLAEILYFFDPINSNHSKFSQLASTEISILSACHQMDGKEAVRMTLEEAINQKLVNEIHGYFMAKTQIFLESVGINANGLRFRQHLDTEMAHYAKSCWDVECLNSNGWLEIVGIADRGCFDLLNHSDFTGTKLTALRPLDTPMLAPRDVIEPKSILSEDVQIALKELNHSSVEELKNEMNASGQFKLKLDKKNIVTITSDMVEFKKEMTTVYHEDFVPAVLEPSFGIDRIMYSVLDHNLKFRGKSRSRVYLSLPPLMAPLKCTLLPLGSNEEFKPFVDQLSWDLDNEEVLHDVDDTRFSIGRRYVRSDELGTPFAITVDFNTLEEPNLVTIRDRDTTEQIQVPISDAAMIVKNLSSQSVKFVDLCSKYGRFGIMKH